MVNLQPRTNPDSKIAVFAGAIGGSVGLLFLLSLGLAVNLYRKRRVARNRMILPSRDDASLFTEGSDDRSQADGRSSFVPRYFSDPIHSLPPHTQGSGRPGCAGRPPPQLREETQLDDSSDKIVIPKTPLPVYTPSHAIHPPI